MVLVGLPGSGRLGLHATALCWVTVGHLLTFSESQFVQPPLAGVALWGSRVSPGLVR